MNNKRYKTILTLIVFLIVLAGGLFIYQNVVVSRQAQAKEVSVYVAKADIQAYTDISANQFNVIKVSKDSVIPGLVTNINSVVGEQLKGGLLKGEPLSTQRLQPKDTKNDGDLSLDVQPDSSGTVQVGDNVRIYAQFVDKNTNQSTIKVLFDNKKVTSVDTTGTTTSSSNFLNNSKAQAGQGFRINVTDQELQEYYTAKQTGYILVAKIGSLDDGKLSSNATASSQNSPKSTANSTEAFNPNSSVVKNATKVKNSNGQEVAVMSYVIQKGDTLDSLALKFKTDNATLSGLNSGKTTFTPGENITVPAN